MEIFSPIVGIVGSGVVQFVMNLEDDEEEWPSEPNPPVEMRLMRNYMRKYNMKQGRFRNAGLPGWRSPPPRRNC